jgi:hypothetical protein
MITVGGAAVNSRTFLGLLITVLVAGAFGGQRWDSNQSTQTVVEFDRHGDFKGGPTPQTTHARRWEATKNERTWISDPTQLIGPLYAKVGPIGNAIVFDYGDMGVKELSAEGRMLGQFGKEIKFRSLTDIGFGANGDVWVTDNSSRAIYVFNRERHLDRTIPTSVGPFRLAHSRNGMFLMIPYPLQAPFARLSPTGATQSLFGRLLTNQHEGILALSGWIESTNDDGFVYVSEYTGAIARYNSQGQPAYFRSALDPQSLPKVLATTRGFVYVDREAPIRAFSLSVDGINAYILVPINIGLKKIGAIDTYDIVTGSYVDSFYIPERCEQAIVRMPYVYTVYGNRISKWRMEQEQDRTSRNSEGERKRHSPRHPEA